MNKVLDSGFLEGSLTRLGKTERREEFLFLFSLHFLLRHSSPSERRDRGGSRIFFTRGCTRLLLYFNTNKQHSFFLQNTSCIRKPQVISGGGGGGLRTPCTLPLDPPLQEHAYVLETVRFIATVNDRANYYLQAFTRMTALLM